MYLNLAGWDHYLQKVSPKSSIGPQEAGRITQESKTEYLVITELGQLKAVLAGKFHLSKSPEIEFPKVGDWVRFYKVPNEDKVRIEEVLPRFNQIERKEAGRSLRKQILAANVDVMFLVQALPQDFNLSRLERYLLIASDSACRPVVVLSKADSVAETGSFDQAVKSAFPGSEVIVTSTETGLGLKELKNFLLSGETGVFLGSSGVGKSSLANWLAGADQKIAEVRESDLKGRHTTTSRQMLFVPGGGVIIDTPGMRELGMAAGEASVDNLFEDLKGLEADCRYRDCDHEKSEGCAILAEVEAGRVSLQKYQNFLKLKKEARRFAEKTDKSFRRERKAGDKRLAKKIRNVIKHKYK
jgi:ribosome biogenesis GTPase